MRRAVMPAQTDIQMLSLGSRLPRNDAPVSRHP